MYFDNKVLPITKWRVFSVGCDVITWITLCILIRIFSNINILCFVRQTVCYVPFSVHFHVKIIIQIISTAIFMKVIQINYIKSFKLFNSVEWLFFRHKGSHQIVIWGSPHCHEPFSLEWFQFKSPWSAFLFRWIKNWICRLADVFQHQEHICIWSCNFTETECEFAEKQ